MISHEIESLVSKLTATYLAKGVQPSEIADTLYERNYIDMNITKVKDKLVMTFTFEDDDEHLSLNTMRYTYSPDKKLIRVEQKVGRGRYKVQWDRAEDLQTTLSQILSHASSVSEQHSLMKSLPEELKSLATRTLAA